MKTRRPKFLDILLGVWAFLILATSGCAASVFLSNPSLESPATTPSNSASTKTSTRTNPPSTSTPETPLTETPIPPADTPVTLKPSATPSPVPTLIDLGLRPTVIGTSVAGRPLEVYRFGFGSQSHMIVAGIHGGYEWNTIALAQQLVAYIQNNPDIIPQGKRLYILVALNPDGEARSHGFGGRANDNGVDINRNFPNYWQADWNRQGCWDVLPITGGSEPASEPETRALMRFIQAHPLDALISYHSAAQGIFPGGRPPDPHSVRLAEAIAAISAYPYPPIDGGCEFTGQLVDWTSSRGIASVDVELTNHEDLDFEQNLEILQVFLDWEP
jgi:hypothetical protein